MKQKLLLIMVTVMILLFTACKSSTTQNTGNTGDTEEDVNTTEVVEEESVE